ncbi:hypothetical protein [Halalkalicoccus salilacus]|uniref:hypothetical protein n=1 Tax=Halalkalicoccus salilacus TaxID=3117459 RepID=UPI00300E772D
MRRETVELAKGEEAYKCAYCGQLAIVDYRPLLGSEALVLPLEVVVLHDFLDELL